MHISSENCGVSMQRCRVTLLSGENRGILMPRYQVMIFSPLQH